MGYFTYFGGTINLKDKKAIKLIRYLLKEGIKPFDEVGDLIIEHNGELEFSGEGKYYEDEIEKICYFIKFIDKDAEGEISCSGEDSDDFWKIELNKRGVEILRGQIIYDFERNYKDEDIEEQAGNILNDKELTKKLILSELEAKK